MSTDERHDELLAAILTVGWCAGLPKQSELQTTDVVDVFEEMCDHVDELRRVARAEPEE